MALTSPSRGSAATGLTPRDFYALLDLLASPEEARRVLKEIRDAEEVLKTAQAEARKEQTQLVEAERQLAERRTALDADWAALRQAKIEHDANVVAYQAKQKQAEKELAERHETLVARDRALDRRQAELSEREAHLEVVKKNALEARSKSETEMFERSRALDAREAAVAEREKAAADLAAMLAKVKG